MRVLLAALLVLVAVPVMAQTNPVQAGATFNVQFDHDGQNVSSFQCSVDGKPVGVALPATGRVCAIPGQLAGVHTVTVTATNPFGSVTSAPLTVTAGTAPTAPTNLRIVVQVALFSDGAVEVIAASVTKEPPAIQ